MSVLGTEPVPLTEGTDSGKKIIMHTGTVAYRKADKADGVSSLGVRTEILEVLTIPPNRARYKNREG